MQGPGLFFVMPCIDSFQAVDMRTVSFDVPPQEVPKSALVNTDCHYMSRFYRGTL